MSTTFLNLENNATSTLRADHIGGDGLLKVRVGDGPKFGSTWPARATCVHLTGGTVVIFRLSGSSADDLTATTATEGTTDIDLPAGSAIEMRWTKGAATDIEAAVNALETSVGGGSVSPAGSAGQVQINSGSGFGAVPGTATNGGIALGSGCSADQHGNLAFGLGCTVSGAEGSGCIAGGFASEVVDGTGQGGVDWAFAHGDHNLSQSCASFVVGSYGLGYTRNQFVIGGGTFEYFTGGTAATGAGVGQVSIQPLIGLSTDGTAITLTTGNSGGPGNTVADPIIRSGSAVAFDLVIVGRKTDGSKFARFRRAGLAQNTGGTAAMVGSVETIGTDNNTPGWSVAVSVATLTNYPHSPALKIQATGEDTVHWSARLELVEVG